MVSVAVAATRCLEHVAHATAAPCAYALEPSAFVARPRTQKRFLRTAARRSSRDLVLVVTRQTEDKSSHNTRTGAMLAARIVVSYKPS